MIYCFISLFRLENKSIKLKKNVPGTFQLESDHGENILKLAKRKRMLQSLQKLKEMASTRQYLSTIMKKYAGNFFRKFFMRSNLLIILLCDCLIHFHIIIFLTVVDLIK